MDDDFLLDYDEIIETVRTAEVVTFRFRIISQRLLIDNRFTEIDPPLVVLVPRASSVEERFRSLKQLRPRFKHPEKISAIWWPKMVNALVEHGVWSAILQQTEKSGVADPQQRFGPIMEELRTLERQEVRNAIVGEGYQALWER